MALFLLFGLASLLAQTLLLREISQVFAAHELSLAAALAAWLVWTGAGARLARGGERGFAGAALLFALAAPLNVLAVRLVPGALPALYQPGLAAMLAGPALLCLPAALANGFAAGLALGGRPAAFYAAEAAGSAAAGAFTVLYYHLFPGVEPVLVLAIPALALAAAWAALRPRSPRKAAAAGFAVLVLGAAAAAAPRLWTLKPPAPPPVGTVQTEGSRLSVTADGSVYEDGRPLHAPDDPAPEELVHVPLLALKRPGPVLLHGGGAWFALAEVLKHSPAAAEIAEPDAFKAAALARLAGAKSGSFTELRADPRALAGRDGRYAAVFNAGGPPENAAQNRFYTVEYFRKAAALLEPGGALVFQLPFAENYVPPSQAYAAACVLASARAVFPHVELLPGARLTVLASRGQLNLDPAALAAAYARRKIHSRFVVPSALPFILDPYRRAWAAGEIAKVKDPPLNTDLDPLSYFNFWRAWLSMVMSPGALLGLAALAGAAAFAGRSLAGKLRFSEEERTGEAFLVGFWALGFETTVLLAFQSGTGRLSPELGAMFALFMAGAAAGRGRSPRTVFLAESAAAALALCAGLHPQAALAPWSARTLILLGGGASGAFFAAAAGSAGRDVYAWDLAGGAAGGLAAAAFSVPLAGIRGSFYIFCAAAAAALAGGLLARRHSEKASTVKE